jgi:cysteine-rich repeat protein
MTKNWLVGFLLFSGCGAVCGNLKIERDETCDDGNVIGGDGCDVACITEACGDGLPSSIGSKNLSCFNNESAVALGAVDLGGLVPVVNIPVEGDIAVADINNDGIQDLIVTAAISGHLVTLLGNGNGTFQSANLVFIDQGPFTIATGDFNKDNNVDLVITRPLGNTLGNTVILTGDGQGAFTAIQQFDGVFNVNVTPIGVVVADLDNDQDEDIAIANLGTDNVNILFNDGNAVFTENANLPAIALGANSDPTQITAGDINNDGKLDLAVATSGFDGVTLLLQDALVGFQAPVLVPTADETLGVTLADINNDGKLDFAAASRLGNTLTIALQQADGSFVNTNITTQRPRSVVAADIDEDGDLDLFAASDTIDAAFEADITLVANLGGGVFSDQLTTFKAGDQTVDLVVQDIDNDQHPDLSIININSDSASVFLANP